MRHGNKNNALGRKKAHRDALLSNLAISLIDHNVGRMIAELHRLGLADNTLIIYASDHGDWLGDHGLLLKGPIPYEGLIRVACLVQGPGVPKGRRVDEPVSTLDVPATLLDYAGAEPLAPMHSQSLRPLIEGTQDDTSRVGVLRLVADHVGQLTDDGAARLHRRLTGHVAHGFTDWQ